MPTTHPLRQHGRPAFDEGERSLRLVDLFCGCGGLTQGVAQAVVAHGIGLDVVLAVDCDEDALSVYRTNFSKANTSSAPLQTLIDGTVGSAFMTVREAALLKEVGGADVIVAGPPCQGHSDLNNHTRRTDPKNQLYLRAVRAVQVFGPRVAIIENVPAVVHSRPDVVAKSIALLEDSGYSVHAAVLDLSRLGVPQSRKRHVLLATAIDGVDSKVVLEGLRDSNSAVTGTVRWAIGDLTELTERSGIDAVPRASAENRRRMDLMLRYGWHDLPSRHRPPCHQDGTSYTSVYGRLRWEKPAPTITSGFTSFGQGRFMHPDQPRALTHHEAARLQGFPDYFEWGAVSRTSLATMIGNAVPPMLGAAVISVLFKGGLLRDDEG